MDKSCLVTGGTGFIGSHTVVELAKKGYQTVILDSLLNSSPVVLDRLEELTKVRPHFVEGDVRDRGLVEKLLRQYEVDSVLHFAGLKAVNESSNKPLTYYNTNVLGTISLLEAMQTCGVYKFVFSSSATVYGVADYLPLDENHPLRATNPYGRSKLIIEDILRDLSKSDLRWRISILRYFNPVGAHPSGLIGEDPIGVPNNLSPYILRVALGRLPYLQIFGDDYNTPDGTGVRDYIHVQDLAAGHIKALEALEETQSFAVNLGTGQGYSVMEMLRAFEKASGKDIPIEVLPRRAGDIASSYADTKMAKDLLGWSAELDIQNMCEDSWNWANKNPTGYGSKPY